MALTRMVLCLLGMLLPGCAGLVWVSPEGGSVRACGAGADVTLPFNFTLQHAEETDDIRWLAHLHDGSEELMAVYIGGDFLPRPAYSGRLTHEGGASVTLRHVTPDDAGTYTVQVEVGGGSSGSVHKYFQTARLSVGENETRLEEIERVLLALQRDNAALNQTVAKLQAREIRLVSFHATLTNGKAPPNKHPIPVNDIRLNIGNAYDNATGYFTAPYTGIYFFAATSSSYSGGHDADTDIMAGGSTIDSAVIVARTRVSESNEGKGESGSAQALVRLAAGEKVWLRSYGMNYLGHDYTTFSGFLVQSEE